MEKRLLQFSGEIFSGCGLGAWCFRRDEYLFYTTSAHQRELLPILEIGGVLSRVLAEENADSPIPILRTDETGFAWISERVNLAQGGEVYILCGPGFITRQTRETIIKKLAGMKLSVQNRTRYINLMEEIPAVDAFVLGMVCRMLHFVIYEEYLDPGFIQVEEDASGALPEVENGYRKDDQARFIPVARTETDFGRMTEVSQSLLDCVRTGMRPSGSWNSHHGTIVDYGLQDDLRTMKDNTIIFQYSCYEAAVEGGLPVNSAREWMKKNIVAIERSTTISQAAQANWKGLLAFIDAVANSRTASDKGISQAVQSTLAYIRAHCREELPLADLASRVGYNEYYLSRKFSRETGVKIQTFIKETRINMAKVMLTSTQKSIFQIAEELQFKSRSHFDRTFTEIVGISPAQYREKRGMQ